MKNLFPLEFDNPDLKINGLVDWLLELLLWKLIHHWD